MFSQVCPQTVKYSSCSAGPWNHPAVYQGPLADTFFEQYKWKSIHFSLSLTWSRRLSNTQRCVHTHTHTNTIFSHFFQFKWFAITVTPSFISKIVSTLLMCACTFFLSASQQHLWFIAAIKVIINSFTILTNTGLPVIYEANSLQGWAAEQGRIKMVLIDKLTG